jgi:hypothetical protein
MSKNRALKAVAFTAIFAALFASACGSSESNQYIREPAPDTPSRSPSGADGTYNCDDFDTHDQAQEYFDSVGDIDGLDGNGDGVACESLPS